MEQQFLNAMANHSQKLRELSMIGWEMCFEVKGGPIRGSVACVADLIDAETRDKKPNTRQR